MNTGDMYRPGRRNNTIRFIDTLDKFRCLGAPVRNKSRCAAVALLFSQISLKCNELDVVATQVDSFKIQALEKEKAKKGVEKIDR